MKWKPIKTNRRCQAVPFGDRCTTKASWCGDVPLDPDADVCAVTVRVEICRHHASMEATP